LGTFNHFNQWEILLKESSYHLTLDEAFSKFLSDLEIKGNQTTLISNRQNGLRLRLVDNAPYDVDTTLLIGSYARYSQIKPLGSNDWEIDIDALAILKGTQDDINKYFHINDNGTLLLCDTESTLSGYQGVHVETDSPCVTASWKTLKMKVEITPAFRGTSGGYLIPNPNYYGSWIETDPITDASLLTERNKECNGDFKPLTKAIKCWNRRMGKPLSSFAIESLLYQTTKNYSSFYFDLSWFFKQLLEKSGTSISSPSGVGADIPLYVGHVNHNITNAIESIEKSQQYQRAGQNRDSVLEMAKVFGEPFPLASTLNSWDFC
jgi:hypothetical protein